MQQRDATETYDVIVIGAGPSGCAVASRLSENPSVSVCLLEAGPDRRGFLATNAAAGAIVLSPRRNASNWGFSTVPDPGIDNRRDFHPLGRGLGGGTSINTLMYMRGNRRDYDGWAARGNVGWGYDDVLPYFRKSENNQTHRNGFHGQDGPVWVEDLRTDNPWHGVLARACTELGWKHNPDFNGADQEGFNTVQVMMKGGERWHAGKAYILPHLATRPNLSLQCETDCTRILFEGKTAKAVEVVNKGQTRVIAARREIIVSAGGILSAKLLQLSGVGDATDLVAHGIRPVHELKQVGRNLQDHLDVVLGFQIPLDPNLLGVSPVAGWSMLKAWRRWQKERRGMLATNFAEVTGFMNLRPESPMPDIQYEFVITIALDHGRDVRVQHGMSCHVLLLHPRSHGSVKLASPDWRDDPLIDFRYLSHPDDLDDLAEGVRRSAQVFATSPFRGRVRRDLLTAHCRTMDDWKAFCRATGGTNYHPVGTCRMAPTPDDGVVDARLRVHGLQNLRVIDSSIMPAICGGNTTAPAYMIGEKGADMIWQDWR